MPKDFNYKIKKAIFFKKNSTQLVKEVRRLLNRSQESSSTLSDQQNLIEHAKKLRRRLMDCYKDSFAL